MTGPHAGGHGDADDSAEATRESVLRRFSGRLESVRLSVGKPSYAKLQSIVEYLRPSTISTVLRGETNPTLDFVLHFVRACAMFARRAGHPISRELLDEDAWRNSWLQVQRQLSAIRRKAGLSKPGDQPECHLRSILAVVWAYHTLDSAAQAVFRVLSLHPNPDLDVSEACRLLGMTPAETRRHLGLLVSANLAKRTAEDRYRIEELFGGMAVELPEQGERRTIGDSCQSCPSGIGDADLSCP